MNILYLCHRLPYPPKRGGKIRPFNMIRHLAARGARLTVASLARSAAEAAEGEGLRAHCRELVVETVGAAAQWARTVARLPTPTPSSMGYFHSPRLARRLHSVLAAQRFDLVFVHCSSMAPYVARVAGVPKMLDYGDMDSFKWRAYAGHKRWPWSWGYALEGAKLARAERRLAGCFDFLSCTTRAELDSLRSLGVVRPSDWFPNGVDAAYFAPGEEAVDEKLLSFVGRMDYFPNQQAMFWFCREVWPRLRAREPGLRLAIVGAAPPPAVRRLGRLPGVTVTGQVDDVRPWVRRSAVNVAPLQIARGTQNKILECLAMGVPVVCSRAAARGVDVRPGEDLLTADAPAEFAAAVWALLRDPARRRALGAAGRARVLARHDWGASMRRLEGLIERCLAARRAA
ncbi:MAG: glycosyl transferase [Gammaproteobacteria bacterium]|nr:MAG: glycosyl transferase [Gammaproteobacteria bacterium]